MEEQEYFCSNNCGTKVIYPGKCLKCFEIHHKLQQGKEYCGGCKKDVLTLRECYVSNKCLFRCILCCTVLQKTKKTFSWKKVSAADRKYGPWRTNQWKPSYHDIKNYIDKIKRDSGQDITEQEARECMGIVNGDMGGIKLLSIFFKRGKETQVINFPMFFCFIVMSEIKKNNFTDPNTGRTNDSESVLVKTLVYNSKGAAVHLDECRCSDNNIIEDIRRKLPKNPKGAVGFMYCDELDGEGKCNYSSIWSFNDPGEALLPSQLIANAWEHLKKNDQYDGLIAKLNEVGIIFKYPPEQYGLGLAGRFTDELLIRFRDGKGVFVRPGEPNQKKEHVNDMPADTAAPGNGDDDIPF